MLVLSISFDLEFLKVLQTDRVSNPGRVAVRADTSQVSSGTCLNEIIREIPVVRTNHFVRQSHLLFNSLPRVPNGDLSSLQLATVDEKKTILQWTSADDLIL